MRIKRSRPSGFQALGLLIILLIIGLVLSGCTQIGTIPRGWSGGTIADDTLFVGSMKGELVAVNISDGSRLWASTLEGSEESGGGFGCAPTATSVAVYGSPEVADDLGLVYVAGYNGKVYAFDKDEARGEPRWVYPRQGNIGGAIVGRLVAAHGKVYFGAADGKVYALDAADGYKEWEFETGDKIWSTPAIDGDTLFIGSFDKKLYALNAADGSEKWPDPFESDGAIVSTPVVHDGKVYFGSFDRHLYALNVLDGTLVWRFPADDERDEGEPANWFWTAPVVYNETIYAANLDGKVYALNAGNGEKLVEFDLGSPISSAPVLSGTSVIVATEEGVVYSLGTDQNQKRQLVDVEEKIYAPLTVSQGIVYVHSAEGSLYGVDTQTGAIREFNID